MDALTHSATGLLLARAGLNRWTPLAAPILILAANAPDLDYASAAFGPLSFLRFHYGWTHALAALPVLAALSVLLVRFAGGKAAATLRWPGALAAAAIGVMSHLALDAATSAGIPLLAPISADLARLDWIAWFDIVVWLVLGLALAGPFISRLVGQEITSGSLRHKWPGRGFPIFALLFVCAYICGRGVIHSSAIGQLGAWNYAGEAPFRLAAIPTSFTPLRWHGVVETRASFGIADMNLAGDFEPGRAVILHKPEPDSAIDAAKASLDFRAFLRRARFVLWRALPAPEPENAKLVQALDLALDSPSGAGDYQVEALVSERMQVLQTSIHLSHRLIP